jgi:hypothetical protein
MTQLQEKILFEYRGLLNDPPMRVISENTGIGPSRIFRLFNGSEMNLKEYQIFKREIKKLKNIGHRLEELFETCLETLSVDKLDMIETLLEQRLLVLKVTA